MSVTVANIICSNILFILAGYNLSKLPWYTGIVSIPKYGLEASMPFHSIIGYRGSKLQSHPILFLTPHVIMGSIILILFGLYLRNDDDDDDSTSLVKTIFLPLTIIFAIHVIPERSGIPNRSKGKPLNEFCIVTILSVAAIHLAGYLSRETAIKIAFVPCLGAPVLELLPVISCFIKKIKSNGDYKCQSDDGEEPLKRNMNGYSGCPFAKAIDVTTQGYPSTKKTT